MPWYLRKSFGSGPFRINLSKGGIGFSTGIKGLRISTNRKGTYIHAGRGGIYYRQRLGATGRRTNPQGPPSANHEPTQSAYAAQMEHVGTAHTSELIDDSSASILAKLNARIKEPQYLTLVYLGVFLASVAICIIWEPIGIFVTLIAGLIPISIVSNSDYLRRTYPLLYELEEEESTRWNQVQVDLAALARTHSMWRVQAIGAVTQSKYAAGATHNLDRVQAKCIQGDPPHIATNVSPYYIQAGSFYLCFLPDLVYVLDNKSWGAVAYDDLKIAISTTHFIEHGVVPADARVVGRTWQYVNKDGSPDRRFNNNREIPVCEYQVIHLTSSRGLNVVLHASSQAFRGVNKQSARRGQGGTGQNSQARASKSPPPGATQAPKIDPVLLEASELLGITPSSSDVEATATYRSLVKRYHPDVVHHLAPDFRALAEERMKEINEAYSNYRRLRGWR